MLDLLRAHLASAASFIIRSSRQELVEQGHFASEELDNSFEYKIASDGSGATLTIWANDYALDLNEGIKPQDIRHSVYDLFDWAGFLFPEKSFDEKMFFAENVYARHLEQGVPTAGSYDWTKNGRRTGWIEFAIDKKMPEIEALLDLYSIVNKTTQEIIDTMVAEAKNV